MAVVIQVNWVIRERDGKLGYMGFRRVTRPPKQSLMVEVLDGDKGIQDDAFYKRCERIAEDMERRGIRMCVEGSVVHLPSAS